MILFAQEGANLVGMKAASVPFYAKYAVAVVQVEVDAALRKGAAELSDEACCMLATVDIGPEYFNHDSRFYGESLSPYEGSH